jgi:hypothetical protein
VSHWDFIVADRLGNELGELTGAKDRKVALPLSRIVTGSFTVDTSNNWTNILRELDQNMVKAYRNGVLMGQGPVITTQKVRSSGSQGSGSSMAVNWASIGWHLGIRLIEESKHTKGIEYGKPEESGWEDAGQMAVRIINGLNQSPLLPDHAGGANPNGITIPSTAGPVHPAPANVLANAEKAGIIPYSDTGVRVGTVLPCQATNVGPWYYQNALGGISLIASTLSGFDWEIAPVEPYKDNIGMVFGLFNCQPSFGATKADVVFEYGVGKNNVGEFTELLDATGLLNRAYATPTGFPENATERTIMEYDWLSMEDRGNVYEDLIPSDAISEELRNRLLQNHVLVRGAPKSVITFKPTNDTTLGVMPEFGAEFELGDLVHFHAKEFGVETFDGLVRVYEADFEIDDLGNETMTPILIEQQT